MTGRSRYPTNSQARTGAAVVEFAVVLPLLAILVFGIMEFGHLFFVRQGLINAARVGARTATLAMADEERFDLVMSRVQDALEVGGLSGYVEQGHVTIEYDPAPGEGLPHVVTITLPYSEVSLLGLDWFFASEYALRSRCAMFRDELDG